MRPPRRSPRRPHRRPPTRRRATRRSWSRTSRGSSCGGSSSRTTVAAPSLTTLFLGNRSTLGVRYDGRRWATERRTPVRAGRGPAARRHRARAAGQRRRLLLPGRRHVQLSVLPAGTERGVHVGLTPRSRWRSGRLSFTAPGPEPPSDPTESLARARLSARLLGDMEGSLYERAWDGGRARLAHGDWQWTATAAMPTQGTFEESANLPIDRVQRRDPRRHRNARRAPDRTRLQAVRDGVSRHPRRARPARQHRAPRRCRRCRHRHGGRRRRPACIPRDRGAWDFTAWSAAPVRGLVRAAASRPVGAGRRRLPLASRTRAAVVRAGHGLRIRRWRRDGRPARDVLPDAALGRPLRAVEHLRPDERARRLGRGAARAAPRAAPAGRRAPGVAGLDRRPLVLGQRRHRAARQLLRLPGPQHPRRRHAGHDGRRRGDVAAGPLVDAVRLRWPTWPAATRWAPSSPTAAWSPRPWSIDASASERASRGQRTARRRPGPRLDRGRRPRRSRCSHRRGPCS